jgi:2-furoate---CoA ligase
MLLIARKKPYPRTALGLDLGRTFLAAVERSPDALAIVDGERRPSYAAWYSDLDPGMLSIRLRGAGDAA